MGAKRDFALIKHGHLLSELDDLDITSPADNSVLQYDSASSTWQDVSLSSFNSQLDHGALTGLSDDDHPQYPLAAGTETIGGSWTFSSTPVVPNDSWTYAKIQNVSATSRVLGRVTSGAGDIEELTAANLKTILALTSADISDFTEAAQDAVFGAIADSSSIDVTYNDAGNSFSLATINANPTGTIGLTAVNGTAATPMRSDAAPALSQAIAPLWSANHRWDDGKQIQLGTDGDFLVYHNGTDGFLTNATGLINYSVTGGVNRHVFSATNGRMVDVNSTAANGPYITFLRSGTAFGDFGNAAQLIGGGTLDGIGFVTRGTQPITLGTSTTGRWIGTDDGHWRIQNGALCLLDGITAPATVTGFAAIYVDTADGDLKIKFADGTVKTIVTD